MLDVIKNIDFARNTRFVIPFALYVFTFVAAFAIRRDWGYLWSRDVARLGSEFCKIACALLLGSIALGFDSEPLARSWIGKMNDRALWCSLLLLGFFTLFFISYASFYEIEGKRPWRREMKYLPWLIGWIIGQGSGLAAIWYAIKALRGEG